MRLSEYDRHQVAHYLDRCDRLHPSSGEYRLFWETPVDSRAIRVNTRTREYLGHYYSHHGQYHNDYFFMYFTNPVLDTMTGSELTPAENSLRAVISAINRIRPK